MEAQRVELTCGPLVAGGKSLVRREGEPVVLVEGGLPGERVEAVITKAKRDVQMAQVLRVIEPSPDRVSPPCPMFEAGCGGCQWQHAAIDAQHRSKLGIVTDALARIAKVDDAKVTFGGAIPAEGYRTTMRLGVTNGRAGLRKRATNDLVALDVCRIAHPLVEDLIQNGQYGDAREVTLRASVATGERMAMVSGDADGLRLPSDVMITTNGKGTAVREVVGGRSFRVSARSFFQSGPAAAELLATTVDRMVDDDADWVVDAYAGVGVLGAIVAAKRDAILTAIEQDASAVGDARSNLSDLNAHVLEHEVAEMELGGMDTPDVVIADPARTGLGPSASQALAAMRADQIVLVSCDPASLARDVRLLADKGYALDEVVVLDLFPHSHHVEAVSTFRRR